MAAEKPGIQSVNKAAPHILPVNGHMNWHVTLVLMLEELFRSRSDRQWLYDTVKSHGFEGRIPPKTVNALNEVMTDEGFGTQLPANGKIPAEDFFRLEDEFRTAGHRTTLETIVKRKAGNSKGFQAQVPIGLVNDVKNRIYAKKWHEEHSSADPIAQLTVDNCDSCYTPKWIP